MKTINNELRFDSIGFPSIGVLRAAYADDLFEAYKVCKDKNAFLDKAKGIMNDSYKEENDYFNGLSQGMDLDFYQTEGNNCETFLNMLK